jgi:hypothetical protein
MALSGFVLLGECVHRGRRSDCGAVKRISVVEAANGKAGPDVAVALQRRVVPFNDRLFRGRPALSPDRSAVRTCRAVERVELVRADTPERSVAVQRAQRGVVHVGYGLHGSRVLR